MNNLSIKLNYISTYVCAFFFFALLISPESFKIAALPVVTIALFSIIKTKPSLKIQPIKFIIVSLAGYFILTALSLLINGGNPSELDMPSRVILAILVLLFVAHYPPTTKGVFWGISLGAVFSSLIAIYHINSIGGRAFDHIGYMLIQAGDISASLCVLSLVSILFAKSKKDRLLVSIASIGFLLTLVTTILSEVRGAWIFTPVIILALLVTYRALFSNRSKILGLTSIILIAIFAYPTVKIRFDTVMANLTVYEHKESRNSVGARLDLWKAAMYSAQEKPLFGQGFNGVIHAKEKLIEQGKVGSVVLKYTRAHNQFFEELQTKGLIGVLVILCFFFIPLWALVKKWIGTDIEDDRHFFALAGCVHITAVIGYCLTQHFLAHHSGIIMYSLGTAIFAGAAFAVQQSTEVEKK